jgi:hypothetical protein
MRKLRAPWRDKRSNSETHRWRNGIKIARIKLNDASVLWEARIDGENDSIVGLMTSSEAHGPAGAMGRHVSQY